jgi:hypothetical protein
MYASLKGVCVAASICSVQALTVRSHVTFLCPASVGGLRAVLCSGSNGASDDLGELRDRFFKQAATATFQIRTYSPLMVFCPH